MKKEVRWNNGQEPKHHGPVKAAFGTRQDIIKAFSEAWKNGNTFHIEMRAEGQILVSKKGQTVAYFTDPERFAEALFPEMVK